MLNIRIDCLGSLSRRRRCFGWLIGALSGRPHGKVGLICRSVRVVTTRTAAD